MFFGNGFGFGLGNFPPFVLTDLFLAGEQGFIFDPSTTGTLYQTTAMTVPARPGDPVGMMLDQSQWGGAALGSLYGASDGAVTLVGVGWTNNGDGTYTTDGSDPTATGRLQFSNPTAGGIYRVEVEATMAVNLRSGGTTIENPFQGDIIAPATVANFNIIPAAAGTVSLISVREVTVANALAPILGPELVTNGTFATDTNWTKGDGWTISGGKARSDGTQLASSNLNQSGPVLTGKLCQVSYTISEYSGGSVRVFQGGTGSIAAFKSANGDYTDYLISTSGAATLVIQADIDFIGAIDNVSVKEIPGYHATQATAAKRPTYGIHPFGGRRNLLVYSEDFSNAAWVKSNISLSPATDILGIPATTFTSTNTNFALVSRAATLTAGAHTFSFLFKAGTAPVAWIELRDFTGSTYGNGFTYFDSATEVISGTAAAGVSAEAVAAGVWRISLTTTIAAGDLVGSARFGFSDAAGSIAVTLGATADFTAAQLEQSATATDYQKVTSQYVVTETGVPSVHYLAFDGVDDAMATPSIDFTAKDEISVFGGVRKFGTAVALLTELSTNAIGNNGTFYVTSPLNGNKYTFRSTGTNSIEIGQPTGVSPPITNILSAFSKITTPITTLRVDGSEVVTSAASIGTGNFGNYPLYIGARAGTSLFFNGHLYGLIVRGALTNSATIAKVEALVAAKTGITL